MWVGGCVGPGGRGGGGTLTLCLEAVSGGNAVVAGAEVGHGRDEVNVVVRVIVLLELSGRHAESHQCVARGELGHKRVNARVVCWESIEGPRRVG